VVWATCVEEVESNQSNAYRIRQQLRGVRNEIRMQMQKEKARRNRIYPRHGHFSEFNKTIIAIPPQTPTSGPGTRGAKRPTR
jgi:hypothetical protein